LFVRSALIGEVLVVIVPPRRRTPPAPRVGVGRHRGADERRCGRGPVGSIGVGEAAVGAIRVLVEQTTVVDRVARGILAAGSMPPSGAR
jgi:hypothetical protein